ncbi:MAG TPA: CHASE3 domain-containing protein [Caulobacteraceae bacterium]|nr:CHASE3 domain-containing protein [Caulobacteraceae bacterium]
MGFKRIVAAAIALALLVAGLSLFLILSQTTTLTDQRAWVGHTRSIIDTTGQLMFQLQAAQDSERGYLITEDPRYLEAYRDAEASLTPLEAQLQGLVTDNPQRTNEVRALIGLVERRRAGVTRVIQLGQAGDFAAARATVTSGRGSEAMNDLRAQVTRIISGENDLLASRTASAVATQELSLFIGMAVALLALVMLAAGLILLAFANRRLNRAIAGEREARSEREAIDALTNAIFNNVPDYLIVLNIEDEDRFVVADINPALARALQVSAEQVRGKSIDDLVPPEPAARMISHYRRVRDAGRPVTTRDVFPETPQGRIVWESILAPVRNSDGRIDRLIGSIRDITERVRGEERLRESQRMEAIGQLTGGVAHDFNNLLQVIRGNLELLQRNLEGDERGSTRLRNAIYGAERAAQLTRQLLAFARRQPLAPKVVNLSRLVSDMADLLRRTLGEAIEVETVVAGGLWNTVADPAQVESAILNLALNARDAMPGGGRLTVEITNASLDDAYARAVRDVTAGQYVMLAVTDTGQGMPEDVRAHVFEPFFTTKSDGKGTGLGLSMVYGFVKQSNGHVQIYSEVGQGTTVKIYLPRSREAVQKTLLLLDPAPPADTAKTVLVVEDEAAVREAALAMIEEMGYRRLEAGDAASALALVQSGEPVDLVFTDVVMPGPLATREFAQRLKELRPGLPVLFTSGYTDNAIIHQGRLDAGVHLISKPYAKTDLARRIATLLADPTAAP